MKKITLFVLLWSMAISTFSQVTYTANDFINPYTGLFRPGMNMGYYPPYNDYDLANIAAGDPTSGLTGIGVKTMRPALYDWFVEDWGYDLHIPTYDYYEAKGMTDLTCIIGFPAEWHRDQTVYCSDGVTQSELFANLYTPVWDGGANGTPYNDDNYLAAYLYELVTLYGDHVKFWEIWNEPGFDYTWDTGWRPPGDPNGNWWDQDPDPCDYKLRAPVEHFVRTLRISYDVIKTVDPDAYVTLAGVGFESFLDAVLRNTDNPNGGSVTPEYPYGGGAYFDVMGFHTYPDIDGSVRRWDSNLGQFVWQRHSDAAAEGIPIRINTYQNRLAQYGYDGNTYPKKQMIITEINTPRRKFNQNSMASQESQTNYTIKMMVVAMREGILQMHPYQLMDRETEGAADDEFDLLGYYKNHNGQQPYDNLTKNENAYAYKTASDNLFGTEYDAAKTASMNLPNNLDGGAFWDQPNNRYVYVLWAKTTIDQSESAFGTYSFPGSFGYSTLTKRLWNYSETGANENISANNINLTGRPIFLLDGPDQNNGSITLSCPANQNLTLPQGSTTMTVTWNDATASTTCPSSSNVSVSQSEGMTSGSNFPAGIQTITYQATDDCGNTASCSFSINITQSNSSNINFTWCSPTIWVTADPGMSGAEATWNLPIAVTSCPSGNVNLTQTEGQPNGSVFPIGVHSITYTATDDCGNSAVCSFSVNVQESSTSDCDNISGFTKIGELDGHGFYVSDNPANWSAAQATAAQHGGYLASIQTQQENNLIHQNINEQAYIGLNDVASEGNLIWDSGEPLVYSNLSTSCPWCNDNGPEYDYAAMLPWDGTWVFENQWVQRIYVMELVCGTSSGDLTINCPADMSLTTSTGTATANWSAATATTTCTSGNTVTVTQISGMPSGSDFSIGAHTITYQATDQCGNTATCSFTISVSDEGSTSCPPTLSGYTKLGEYNGHGYYLSNDIMTWNDANTTAASNGGYLASIQSSSENEFLQGMISEMVFMGLSDESSEGNVNWNSGEPVSYTNYSDCSWCGENTADNDYGVLLPWDGSWSFDNQWVMRKSILEMDCGGYSGDLTMNCPSDLQVSTATNTATVSWPDPTASTNCSSGSAVSITQTTGLPSGSDFPIGSQTISYHATDLCDNSTSCSFTVTVTGSSTGCDEINGFSLLGELDNHGYYLSDDIAPWSMANTMAQNNGGYLATMNSQAENNFLMSNIGNNLVFIGYSDEASEGNGTWANGEPVTLDLSYNNSDENDYAVMNFWAGTWDMYSQWVYKRFVMEKSCGADNQVTKPVSSPQATITYGTIIPNPAKDYISMKLLVEEDTDVDFVIYNHLGIEMTNQSLNYQKGIHDIQFNTSQFPSGIYYLISNNQGLNKAFKFIIKN